MCLVLAMNEASESDITYEERCPHRHLHRPRALR
jgi:hypothetical protein